MIIPSKHPFLIIIAKIVISFFFVYFLLCIFLFFNQKSLIFFPSKDMDPVPTDSNIQELSFKTQDNIRLNGWFIDNKSKKTVIFFHGNWGNISFNKERIRIFNDLWVNGLLFDYRGYGKSEWIISDETDLYMDGEAAYQYMLSRGSLPENIILWWQSLGGAIAIHTAQSKPVFKTIIESTFVSMDRMAADNYWFFPTHLLLRFHFNNFGKVQNILSPILVIHSSEDELINIQNGIELFQKIKNTKEFLKTTGSHNWWFSESYTLYKVYLQKFLEIPVNSK